MRFSSIAWLLLQGCTFSERKIDNQGGRDARAEGEDSGFEVSGNTLDSSWTPSWANLVGYWPMDGDWDDYSGSGLHGGPVGDISFDGEDAPIGSHSAAFDGDGDFLFIGDELDLIDSPISVAVWVKAEDRGRGDIAPIVDKWSGTGSYRLAIHPEDNHYVFGMRDESGTFEGSPSERQATFGAWQHVVFTYDGQDTSTMYIDGVFDGAKTNHNISRIDIDEELRFGRSAFNGEFYLGHLDDIAIWDVELGSADVRTIYDRQKF